MTIFIILIVILAFFALYALIVIKNRNIKWIPVILTEGPEVMNLREIPYDINFTKPFPVRWQGTEAMRNVANFEGSYQKYIVWGSALQNIILTDGRKISLEEGSCVIVDPGITKKEDKYKVYIVNPYPAFSAMKDVQIKTIDNIPADGQILGAVIASIPAWWMEENRK